MTTTAQGLRLLLVDDHALLRAGLGSVLEKQGFVVCGEASGGEQAVARFDELSPDVTLMDLQMPELDGVAAIAKIRARHPDACILVLTTFDTDDDIERALRAGARGYLLKDAAVDELANAIREVHAGRTRVAPAIAAKLADRMTQVQLTMRELNVLRLLANGKTNKEIGAELSIAESTVKVHLTHLFEKLGVSNRTEAIAAASRRGLVRMR
jgi:two-component system, NarL family, response regulator